MDFNQLDDLLTVKEFAHYIKRSYKTALKLIKEGKIATTDDGSRGYRLHKLDIGNYLGLFEK